MGFRTNKIEADEGQLVGIFVGPGHFYKAILPLGWDIVYARELVKKILTEGFKGARTEDDIPSTELVSCYIATRTELIWKDGR